MQKEQRHTKYTVGCLTAWDGLFALVYVNDSEERKHTLPSSISLSVLARALEDGLINKERLEAAKRLEGDRRTLGADSN